MKHHVGKSIVLLVLVSLGAVQCRVATALVEANEAVINVHSNLEEESGNDHSFAECATCSGTTPIACETVWELKGEYIIANFDGEGFYVGSGGDPDDRLYRHPLKQLGQSNNAYHNVYRHKHLGTYQFIQRTGSKIWMINRQIISGSKNMIRMFPTVDRSQYHEMFRLRLSNFSPDENGLDIISMTANVQEKGYQYGRLLDLAIESTHEVYGALRTVGNQEKLPEDRNFRFLKPVTDVNQFAAGGFYFVINRKLGILDTVGNKEGRVSCTGSQPVPSTYFIVKNLTVNEVDKEATFQLDGVAYDGDNKRLSVAAIPEPCDKASYALAEPGSGHVPFIKAHQKDAQGFFMLDSDRELGGMYCERNSLTDEEIVWIGSHGPGYDSGRFAFMRIMHGLETSLQINSVLHPKWR